MIKATYDPTLEAGLTKYMEVVAKQHGLPTPVQLVYEEFEYGGELKQQVWERIWELIIKREIRVQKKKGISKMQLFEELAARPQLHQCALNSWARHVILKNIRIKTQVCIGSLGIRTADGNVFWEYG